MLIKRDELRNLEIMPAGHTRDRLKAGTPSIFVKLNSYRTHKFGGSIICHYPITASSAARSLDTEKNILRRDC